MNTYSDDNPPRRGTGRKIYDALKVAGITVDDLHYNPNLWGRGGDYGWGTWACAVWIEGVFKECFCGWSTAQNRAYLMGTAAPFVVIWL